MVVKAIKSETSLNYKKATVSIKLKKLYYTITPIVKDKKYIVMIIYVEIKSQQDIMIK